MEQKQDTRETKSPRPAAAAAGPLPAVSLPKGGGAIRGMGEKFAVSPVTGTGALTLPIASSPGRAGFGPQLSLSYDSGAGNGPFGLGWSLGVPAITRKTDKGLPRYDDAAESDVFLLSGAEDLVPVLDGAGARVSRPRTVHGVDYEVRAYRPRIEGLFARIERWTEVATGASHWRSLSKDNVTSLYGRDENSRVAAPDDPRRTFSYLLCRTFDGKGNVTHYEYQAEDGAGVGLGAAHEANRTDATRATQRYLKWIRYGNVQRYLPDWAETGTETPLPADWRFEIVLDYGDHDPDRPLPARDRAWPVRPDPFSAYRAGFEVRTYRRCQRVLLFHHFAEEVDVGADCLVRSTDFTFSDQTSPADPRNPVYTFLQSATQTGYRRAGDGYLRRSMPPDEFEYSQPQIQADVRTLDRDSLANVPAGLDGARCQLVDLDGEGLSGLLSDHGGAWGYKRNLAPVTPAVLADGQPATRACFGPLETLAALPSRSQLGGGGGLQLLDLSGDGQLDLVSFDPPTPGFYERTADQDWQPFRAFASLPQLAWSMPGLKFVDLTGDGHADVLLAEEGLFTYYPSLGEEGFGPAETVRVPSDEERGPKVVLADGAQTVFLADLSGDGLADLVRVRNGEVCYWPNLGYGRFGAKVAMDGAPRFDSEERFDARRVRLADVDGSGTTDLLYVGQDGVQLWFNQSGNAWGPAQRLAVFPGAGDPGAVQVADLLGNGTACLVWSSSLPGDAAAPLRYVDLMGGQKPHLMTRARNNLGAETRLRYAPSTRFYLEDQQAGRPWVTRLPHVVHVVERVEVYDWIGRTRFVTRYAYHHGYYDGEERELRGFGSVEQWDTEEHRDDTDFPEVEDLNWDAASWSPPMRTCTWFHTGAFVEAGAVSQQYAHEYWTEPALRPDARAADREALLLPDTVLPADLDPDELREAYRALKGMALRVEVYAEDGSARAEHPYTVTEQNFTVETLQARGPNRHAVFFAHPREKIDYHYERHPDDPRVTHEVTLEVDPYGNVKRSVSVGYPRRAGLPASAPDLSASFQSMLAYDQGRQHVAATENRFTGALDDPALYPDVHRAPLPAETILAELTGLAPAPGRLLRFDELDTHWTTVWDGGHDVPYEEIPASDVDGAGTLPSAPARRIVEHARTLYRRDDLTALLALGTAEPLALPGESYRLALTPGLLARVLEDKVDAATLAEGGYVQLDGGADWWIPSGRGYYSAGDADTAAQELAEARAHFYLARRAVDPFGAVTRVTYDAYDLLPADTTDPVGNVSAAENDYRVLHPFRVTDPNGNRAEAAFDALGLVAGTAVRGKSTESLGDTLDGFEPDLDDAALLAYFADPLADPQAVLGGASSRIVYDVFAYQRTRDDAAPRPPVIGTLARETHASDLAPGETTRYQHSFSYSDGFEREIQRKVQAEPGPVEPGGGDVAPRWVGSGWTVFNNKAKPVRKYEPFFAATHQFEFARQVGVSTVLFYDPPGRVVATLRPDDTWEKVVFDAWRQESWDANDTVRIADPRTDEDAGDYFRRLYGDAPGAFTSWYDRRIGGTWGDTPEARDAQRDAAQKAGEHRETPTVTHFDALGRPCVAVAHNGGTERHPTRTALDAESKPLAVIDAQGRRVFEYCRREPRPGGGFTYVAGYDVAGSQLYQNGMDGGARQTLLDAAAKPIRSWDARGHAFAHRYDRLRRPTHRTVSTDGGAAVLLDRAVYGEGMSDRNLCGRLYRQYDGGGVATSERYDFKGNLLESSRQLARAYRTAVDWTPLGDLAGAALDAAAAPLLVAADRFTATTAYDALNRAVQTVTPHSDTMRPSVLRSSYNEANLLERMDAWVRVAQAPATLLDPATADLRAVTGAAYNARGQRTQIAYGNGTVTDYTYDALTFRLVRLTTTRPASFAAAERVVQDLAYAYDPAGNVTRLRDSADTQNVVFFRNQRVEPSADYTYDAVYRLVAATGREHLGQTGGVLDAPVQVDDGDGARGGQLQPGDGLAMGNYTETYAYDTVGNLTTMLHQVSSGGWTRSYTYTDSSQVTAAETCNRLSATSVPGDPAGGPYSATYEHDGHGNVVRMPHLPALTWDEQDRLRATTRQVVNSGTPETTYYVYDGAGQRLRKVTDRQAAAGEDPAPRFERLYLGGLEIDRALAADGTTVTLERETLPVSLEKTRAVFVETRTQGTDPGAAQLVRYQHANHLASAILELDDAADVISYEEYFPYGSTSYQAVRSQTDTPKRYRYTGKERDEESGFYYHGARYYAPWLGRWTSCDPRGLAEGPNLYRYASSNPVKRVDPTGEADQDFSDVGLGKEERLQSYVKEVHKVAADWAYLTPEERLGKLEAAVNKQLKAEGLPELKLSENEYYSQFRADT
ncbi:MAG TPA: SpvB/TcaC N-terminal domain-containing protein, partial [Myxococcota bacterium]|nr:SpvB/TcaC N-terminal domain-containing protein [Myxococcota bacterium]